jgi:hypothetical protein
VLAATLVDSLLSKQLGKFEKRLLAGLLVLAVLVLVFFTVGRDALFGAWQGVFGGIDADKLSIAAGAAGELRRDALLLAGCSALVLAIGLSRRRTWRGGNLLVGACLAGALATSLPHSTRFITYIDQYPGLRNWLKPDAAARYLLEDKDIFRVLRLTGSSFYNKNYLPIFGLQTANGFYDNRIRFYETLTGQGQENLAAIRQRLDLIQNNQHLALGLPVLPTPIQLLGQREGSIPCRLGNNQPQMGLSKFDHLLPDPTQRSIDPADPPWVVRLKRLGILQRQLCFAQAWAFAGRTYRDSATML